MRVEGEENGLEAGERHAADGAGEVEAGNGGEVAEDGELEVGVGGLEGVVEPAAEVVVASAGGGAPEVGGDCVCQLWVVQERESGIDGAEDEREGFNGGLEFGV